MHICTSLLSAVGDSAALEESEHGTYTVDEVPFRVDRHTPRRRVLTPDSGMINSTGKKIKLDGQPRATKFTGIQAYSLYRRHISKSFILEPVPTSKYSNPEWERPVSPRRRYRISEVSTSVVYVSIHTLIL